MISYITSIYEQYAAFTSSNQMLGAVMAGLAVTVAGFLFRSVPSKIWNTIKRITIFSVEFNSQAGWRDSVGCQKIAIWANNNKTIFSSKSTIPVFDTDTDRFEIGIGIGNNLIRSGLNLYVVNMDLEKAAQTLNVNYKITISVLWYKKKELEKLLNEVFNSKSKTGLSISEYSDDGEWIEKITPYRNLSTVVTTDNVGEVILSSCKSFIESKDWYRKAGISYKLGIMLYGEPGTGKTSLIKALSSELGRDLYTLNLATSFDKTFVKAIRNIKSGSILSLEDIDCVSGTHSREDTKDVKSIASINLSTILNILDGLVPLDDIIVIMSTNHINKIDKALLRKGRSDLMIEIKPLDSKAVKQYTETVFNESIDFNGHIKGCDLQSIVIEHKDDFQSFKEALMKFSTDNKWAESKVKNIAH